MLGDTSCRRCNKIDKIEFMKKSQHDYTTPVCYSCYDKEVVEIQSGQPYKGIPYWNVNIRHIHS